MPMLGRKRLGMAYVSFMHRGVALTAVTLFLSGCSTDGLIPSASVDTKNQVSAIGPLELEGPVGSKKLSYQVNQPPVSTASQMSSVAGQVVTAPTTQRLPMIDSDEAAGLDTSMGVQPLQLPSSPNSNAVEVASASPSAAANIAENGTNQPVVDGIGTDSPQLISASSQQSSASDLPITWSDSPMLGDSINQPSPVPAPQQQEERLAFVPKAQSPMSSPLSTEPERQSEPLPMSASDIQCRRDLQSLGVQFRDLPTISQGPACGIPHPISVTGFDSGRIRLTPTATLNCEVTLQFAKWIRNELVPSARLRYWSGVKSIRQMSDYSCRRMNSDPNNPWSEHAKGNAIDIGTITLNNGHEIDVEKKGLLSFREGALLNAVRSDSCKYFDTVLGPGSNKYHKDHFHFDLRDRKGGRKYCD